MIKLTEISVEAKWKGLQIASSVPTQSRFPKARVTTSLFYPKHPYSADLYTQISLLPSGFADLSMTGELSTQFISMLARWYRSPLHETKRLRSLIHLPPEAEVFLGSMPSFTISELLVATAIGAYSLCFTAEGGNTIPHLHLQAQAQQLASDAKGLVRCDQKLVLWAQSMIRATTERTTSSWRWANSRLSLVMVTEQKLQEIGDAFFPIPRFWVSDEPHSEVYISRYVETS